MLSISALAVAGNLMDATLEAGLHYLRDNIRDQHNQRHRALNPTFTDKYGEALVTQLGRVFCEEDQSHWPPIHARLLANKAASRDAAIVQQAIFQQASECNLPISEGTVPQITKDLTTEVFRNHKNYHSGLSFGHSLVPVAVICSNHPDTAAAKKRLQEWVQVEEGLSVSLADAREIAVFDYRLPQNNYQIADKIYGCSILLDIYMGHDHDYARGFHHRAHIIVRAVISLIHYYGNAHDTLIMGLRIIFHLQQHWFHWLRLRRITPVGTNVPVPDFEAMGHQLQSYLLVSLSELPASWKALIKTPLLGLECIRGGGPAGGPSPLFTPCWLPLSRRSSHPQLLHK